MSDQQKYDHKIHLILHSKPDIKLEELIYHAFDTKISLNNIFNKLAQLQQQNHQAEKLALIGRYHHKLYQVQAKELEVHQVNSILSLFEPMMHEVKDQEAFQQQNRSILKQSKQLSQNNSKVKKQNEHQQQVNEGNDEQSQQDQQEQQSQSNSQKQPQNEFIQVQAEQNLNKDHENNNIKQESKQNKEQNQMKPKQQFNKQTNIKPIQSNENLKEQKQQFVELKNNDQKDQKDLNEFQQQKTVQQKVQDKLKQKLQEGKQIIDILLGQVQQKEKLKKENQQGQDNFGYIDSDPENVPNFQDQKELQELNQDKINHKNLFDQKNFSLPQSPPGQIKRSNSFFSKQYEIFKKKLRRFLIVSFHQYVKYFANNKNQVFDASDASKKQYMDLTLYLRWNKDFQLKQFLKVNEVTKLFKRQALNRLWLDSQRFINLNYKIIEHKSLQRSEGMTAVTNQDQLLQRAKKFIGMFDRQRIKKYLKVNNKQGLQKLIEQFNIHNKKQEPTSHHTEANKQQIVSNFIKRNFQAELLKWYQKKQVDPTVIKKQKHKNSPNHGNQNRDEMSISDSIKKLKSQSQKKLSDLKAQLEQNFKNQNLQSSQALSSQGKLKRNTSQDDLKNKKAPLHKSKHKNTISVYKQIMDFELQNKKFLKSNRDFLDQLKIANNQPYLAAFFSREAAAQKLNSDRKLEDSKSRSALVQKKKLPSLIKSTQKQSLLKQLNLIEKIQAPIRKSASDAKLSIQKNQFMQNAAQMEAVRKNHIRSQPLKITPSDKGLPGRKRVQSMKKLSQIQHKRDRSSILDPNSSVQYKNVIPINPFLQSPLGGKSKGVILNSKQNQLINKKLYDFLQPSISSDITIPIQSNKKIKTRGDQNPTKNNLQPINNLNKQQRNLSIQTLETKPPQGNNKKIQQKNSINLQKPTQIPRKESIQSIKSSANQQNLENNLISQHEKQIYQLFKNFNFQKVKHQQQKKIVQRQKDKRKGYVVADQRDVVALRKLNSRQKV